MLARKDQENEGSILQRLRIEKTKAIEDRHIVPYSFAYAGAMEYEALVYYWAGCVLQARLCWRAKKLWPEYASNIDLRTIEKEASRMSSNILMSVEYSQSLGAYGIWSIPPALCAVYGAVREYKLSSGIEAEAIRSWVAKKIDHALRGKKKKKEGELDEQADLLVGGSWENFEKRHQGFHSTPSSSEVSDIAFSGLDDTEVVRASYASTLDESMQQEDDYAESMQMIETYA